MLDQREGYREPEVDYETALADAFEAAMPVLELRRQGREVLSLDNFDTLEDLVNLELGAIASENAGRTNDRYAEDSIYNALVAHKLEGEA